MDYKFVFIPVIFIGLRMWSCIDSWTIFAGYKLDPNFWLNQIIIYCAVSACILNVNTELLYTACSYIKLVMSFSFAKRLCPHDHAYVQGIGDSGQGFANAILFVVLSKNVRDSFKRCLKRKKSKWPEQLRGESAKSDDFESSRMLEPSASSMHRDSSTDDDKAVNKAGDNKSSYFYTTYGTLN